MKKVATALAVALAVWVGVNLHPHYGKCHHTIDGKVCTLTHYTWGNK